MKQLLKAASIILMGYVVMSTAAYADESTGTEIEPTAEMIERREAMEAYHKARLEAKKERIRAKMEAKGIDPDSIDNHNPNREGDSEE